MGGKAGRHGRVGIGAVLMFKCYEDRDRKQLIDWATKHTSQGVKNGGSFSVFVPDSETAEIWGFEIVRIPKKASNQYLMAQWWSDYLDEVRKGKADG
jgi:hypothetical protein